MRKRQNGRRGLIPLSLFFAMVLCWCCAGRADFELPESLTEIEDEAFAGCSALNVVNVPEDVSAVGENAFSGCGEALLIVTGAGSEAVLNYARANMVDYRAGTQYRALLIGQMYTDSTVSPLCGPVNDVRALQERLPQIGWEVTAKSDLTAEGIRTWVGTAFRGATENDVSLFFYSGHGDLERIPGGDRRGRSCAGKPPGSDGQHTGPEGDHCGRLLQREADRRRRRTEKGSAASGNRRENGYGG